MNEQNLTTGGPLEKTATVFTNLGNRIARTPTAGDLFAIFGALEKIEIDSLPPTLTLGDLLTQEQQTLIKAADSMKAQALLLEKFRSELSDEDRQLLATAAAVRMKVMFRWAMAVPKLFPVLVAALSNCSPEEALKLQPVPALKLLTAAVELIDLPELVEAALGFFTVIGGLTDEVKKQKKAAGLDTDAGKAA